MSRRVANRWRTSPTTSCPPPKVSDLSWRRPRNCPPDHGYPRSCVTQRVDVGFQFERCRGAMQLVGPQPLPSRLPALTSESRTSDIEGSLLDSMNVSFRASNLARKMSALG